MKKIIRSRVFAFILGALMFGSVGVVSAYTVLANNIGFTPQDETWKVNDVESALNYLYANVGVGNDILWVNNYNDAENVAFEPQTINLDLSKYKSVIILGYYDYRYPDVRGYVEIEVGKTGNLRTIWNYSKNDQTSREISVTTTGVEFKEGRYYYSGTDNTRSIPLYIIGVK